MRTWSFILLFGIWGCLSATAQHVICTEVFPDSSAVLVTGNDSVYISSGYKISKSSDALISIPIGAYILMTLGDKQKYLYQGDHDLGTIEFLNPDEQCSNIFCRFAKYLFKVDRKSENVQDGTIITIIWRNDIKKKYALSDTLYFPSNIQVTTHNINNKNVITKSFQGKGHTLLPLEFSGPNDEVLLTINSGNERFSLILSPHYDKVSVLAQIANFQSELYGAVLPAFFTSFIEEEFQLIGLHSNAFNSANVKIKK